MGKIKVDKAIPVPPKGRTKYPFHEMAVGDSFFATRKAAMSAAQQWAARRIGVAFTSKREGEGWRIWRTR